MKVITTRIEEEQFKSLEMIEKEEHADRAEIVRKLLEKGIKEWRIKKALRLLREKKATIRTAASLAKVTYAEMLDLSSKENIPSGYSLENLKRDIDK